MVWRDAKESWADCQCCGLTGLVGLCALCSVECSRGLKEQMVESRLLYGSLYLQNSEASLSLTSLHLPYHQPHQPLYHPQSLFASACPFCNLYFPDSQKLFHSWASSHWQQAHCTDFESLFCFLGLSFVKLGTNWEMRLSCSGAWSAPDCAWVPTPSGQTAFHFLACALLAFKAALLDRFDLFQALMGHLEELSTSHCFWHSGLHTDWHYFRHWPCTQSYPSWVLARFGTLELQEWGLHW